VKELSRTEYSLKNTSVAMASKIIAIFIGFVGRVVFTHTLSENYVGINGLFSDIINVLSLTELGAGTAITYALYRPIAEKDIQKQQSLMRFYRNFYRLTALIVLTIGLCILPFMDILIKEEHDIPYITLIYLLYLANSVLSYLFIYKRTLIDAHQLSYITTLYQTAFMLLQYVLQITVLITTKNFILYLLILVICTIGNNFAISAKANKLYPYLKEKNPQPLPPADRSAIFRNIRAMLMHKIGSISVNNTDNLILSSMVGILSVGCYSNYYLIIGSVRQILTQVSLGITASVGNLAVTEDKQHVKSIFETAFFIGYWLYGFAAICLFELSNPFVEISFGRKFLFSRDIVLILCLNFFFTGIRQAALVFRDSLGLFWYDRYKAIVEAVLNLLISIFLARQFGTLGVFLGTLISMTVTSLWVEPYVLYRHFLEESFLPYLWKLFFYTAVVLFAGVATETVCRVFSGSAWMLFWKRLPICLLVPNILFLLCNAGSEQMHFLLDKFKGMITKS